MSCPPAALSWSADSEGYDDGAELPHLTLSNGAEVSPASGDTRIIMEKESLNGHNGVRLHADTAVSGLFRPNLNGSFATVDFPAGVSLFVVFTCGPISGAEYLSFAAFEAGDVQMEFDGFPFEDVEALGGANGFWNLFTEGDPASGYSHAAYDGTVNLYADAEYLYAYTRGIGRYPTGTATLLAGSVVLEPYSGTGDQINAWRAAASAMTGTAISTVTAKNSGGTSLGDLDVNGELVYPFLTTQGQPHIWDWRATTAPTGPEVASLLRAGGVDYPAVYGDLVLAALDAYSHNMSYLTIFGNQDLRLYEIRVYDSYLDDACMNRIRCELQRTYGLAAGCTLLPSLDGSLRGSQALFAPAGG